LFFYKLSTIRELDRSNTIRPIFSNVLSALGFYHRQQDSHNDSYVATKSTNTNTRTINIRSVSAVTDRFTPVFCRVHSSSELIRVNYSHFVDKNPWVPSPGYLHTKKSGVEKWEGFYLSRC